MSVRKLLSFIALLTVALPAFAMAQDRPYPSVAADACGGAPGDPPIFVFAPGSAKPLLDNPVILARVRIWRERIRPSITIVLLTGTADTKEAGYDATLGLQRAKAVRDLLATMHIDPATIWVKGRSISPTTAFEHEAIISRNVIIGDPLRVVECNRELYQARFRWFTAHCVGQSIDADTQRTCDAADVDLGGADPAPSKEP